MDKNMFEELNKRYCDKKNENYNETYEMAYEEIEEAIDYFCTKMTNEAALLAIKGYIRGKIDLISTYPVDFTNIKF